jgi:hypothetical protein
MCSSPASCRATATNGHRETGADHQLDEELNRQLLDVAVDDLADRWLRYFQRAPLPCGSPIFIRAPEMRHSVASKFSSECSIPFLYYTGHRHVPSALRAFVDFVKPTTPGRHHPAEGPTPSLQHSAYAAPRRNTSAYSRLFRLEHVTMSNPGLRVEALRGNRPPLGNANRIS